MSNCAIYFSKYIGQFNHCFVNNFCYNLQGLAIKKDPFTKIVIAFFLIDQNHTIFYKYILRYIFVNYQNQFADLVLQSHVEV